MNHCFTILLSAALFFALVACGGSGPASAAPGATISPPPEILDGIITTPGSDLPDSALAITLRIGAQTFSATLADNDAARALAERLPMTLELSELHGNEKFNYLEEALPTASEAPGQINAGDLMLYGSDCLVLFYERLDSAFRYTPLGRIADATGLAEAVGRGGVTITLAVA